MSTEEVAAGFGRKRFGRKQRRGLLVGAGSAVAVLVAILAVFSGGPTSAKVAPYFTPGDCESSVTSFLDGWAKGRESASDVLKSAPEEWQQGLQEAFHSGVPSLKDDFIKKAADLPDWRLEWAHGEAAGRVCWKPDGSFAFRDRGQARDRSERVRPTPEERSAERCAAMAAHNEMLYTRHGSELYGDGSDLTVGTWLQGEWARWGAESPRSQALQYLFNADEAGTIRYRATTEYWSDGQYEEAMHALAYGHCLDVIGN